MTSITRYKLFKVLKYALVTTMVAWVMELYAGGNTPHHLPAWFLLGAWTGTLEEFLFGRRFRALAIPFQLLGKAVAVNLLTVAILAIGLAFSLPTTPLPNAGIVGFEELFTSADTLRLLLRVLLVTTIAILLVQVEEVLGRRVLLAALLGRYDRPRAEERIVLSMDLAGSTALAERLGDLRYYRFLNTTYSLMTDAVLRNEAEIHKYVGDEVIFTWPMRIGLRHHNALDLYFDIMERIDAHAEEMRREFGAVPRYRAAVHGGRLISAQVGHIKRVVDLSGDVMNSVSRMLGLSKDREPGLLASADLLARMEAVQERFLIGPQEVLPVKGKRREVRMHAVTRSRRA